MQLFLKKFIDTLKDSHANLGLIFWNAESETALAKFYFTLIAALIILFVPILISFIFPLFKKNHLSKKGTLLLYAFVTGFFIAMSLFGFLREAIEISTVRIQTSSAGTTYFWNILLVGGGLAVGLSFAYGLRRLIKLISKTKAIKNDPQARLFVHSHELSHDHSDDYHHHQIAPDHGLKRLNAKFKTNEPLQTESKNKVVALLLLLTHRVPAGLLIGYSLNSFFDPNSRSFGALSWAFIISFVLHLIPEILIFFYRQREMGINKWKATFWSISSLLMLIPLMLIGIYLGEFINKAPHAMSFVQALVAGIFLFTSIVEFLPEFYHSHHDKKLFRLVMFVFFAGIVICAIVLSFHTHQS
ncbi:ZIP family metal transporter [Mycoplasmopsis iners]|uniref:ZIP family metal transporter n=1 Tax=Mycoplasmopsis iners TaxID=76630 RepID=UPI00068E8358|nr:ZIP family metal transporter [Mycoplasmopsis iners]